MGQQGKQTATGGFNGATDTFGFVRPEILRHHDVAKRERRDKNLLDIGFEGNAIHRSIENNDAAKAECVREGRCFPMSVRDCRAAALTA